MVLLGYFGYFELISDINITLDIVHTYIPTHANKFVFDKLYCTDAYIML